MPTQRYDGPLEKVHCCWRIPKSYKPGMRVDGLIYANEADRAHSRRSSAGPGGECRLPARHPIRQPGDARHPLGVRVPDRRSLRDRPAEGASSRRAASAMTSTVECDWCGRTCSWTTCEPHLETTIRELFQHVPTGVGRGGKYRFSHAELQGLMARALAVAAGAGLAVDRDIHFTEAHGKLDGPSPSASATGRSTAVTISAAVWARATTFWRCRSSTRSAIAEAAQVMGLEKQMVCVMIHSGSRGLGYQVCDDALRKLRGVPEKYGIKLPDRQLVCAPRRQPAGRKVSGGDARGRQLCLVQSATADVADPRSVPAYLGRPWEELDMQLVYDVAHNIAKFEEHLGRRAEEAGLGASQRGDAGLSAAPSRGASGIRGDWPARAHSRRHGAGQLGAGGPAGQHAADVRQRLPRRRSRDESPRGGPPRPGTPYRPGAAPTGHCGSGAQLEGTGRRTAGRLQGCDGVVDVVHEAGLAKKVVRLRPVGVIKG